MEAHGARPGARTALDGVGGVGETLPSFALASVLYLTDTPEEAGAFVATIKAGGASPPTESLPPPDLLAYLAGEGLVEDTGGGVIFEAGVYAGLVARIREHIEANGSVSLAEVRDLFGTSRKYAQAILEHLDATHVTRRTGDVRVLRSPLEARR